MCDAIRLYKDMMREDTIEFGNPFASFRVPTHQDLKIAERIFAFMLADWIFSLELKRVKRNVANGGRIIARSSIIVQVYPRHRTLTTIILPKVYVVLVHNQYKPCAFVLASDERALCLYKEVS